MFWGLAIEPGKRYMQTVGKSFHLSMASLERNSNDSEHISLLLEYEGREYVLCNLNKMKVMQCQLDLNFQAGEKVAFYSAGKSRIHLTGYLLPDDDLELSEDDEEEEEEEEEEIVDPSPAKKRKERAGNIASNKKPKLDVSVGDEDEDEDEDEDDDDDDDDELATTFESMKDDDEDDDDDDDEEEDEDEEEGNDSDVPVLNNLNTSQAKTPEDKQKKKGLQGQTPKTPNQQNGQVQTPQTGKKNKNKQGGETPKSPEASRTTPQKRVLQGGVVVQDVKVGNGPEAKPGREISVYYVGRLKQNNKQFDSSTSGPGFKFKLCRGEVIKGWDIGVAGMRVGGKRTITVPPQMAYGKKGQPPVIPSNSVLVFDVELKNVF